MTANHTPDAAAIDAMNEADQLRADAERELAEQANLCPHRLDWHECRFCMRLEDKWVPTSREKPKDGVAIDWIASSGQVVRRGKYIRRWWRVGDGSYAHAPVFWRYSQSHGEAMMDKLTKGQRLSEEDVMERIRAAVDDICEDLDDMAALHSIVAQGQLQHDPNGPHPGSEFVVVDEADAKGLATLVAELSEDRIGQ